MKLTVETVKVAVVRGRIESMSTLKIADFLEARIAEDEAEAKLAKAEFAHGGYGCYGPARVLAECAAKRAIIESFAAVGKRDLKGEPVLCGMYSALGDAVADLAAVYAGHEDYRQEWQL